jgi:hypothetical protein
LRPKSGLTFTIAKITVDADKERGTAVSDEKGSNVVRVSDEAFAAVKRQADEKEVSVGAAATALIMRGDSRKRALNRYYQRVVDGDVAPPSLVKAKKAAEKAKAKRAAQKAKAKKAAKKAKGKGRSGGKRQAANGATTQFEVGADA